MKEAAKHIAKSTATYCETQAGIEGTMDLLIMLLPLSFLIVEKNSYYSQIPEKDELATGECGQIGLLHFLNFFVTFD